jgi:uncharacterized protein YggE
MPRSISITLPVPGARGAWIGLGLLLGLAVGAASGPLFATRSALATDPTGPAEHTISVTGTGRIVLSPDTADVRLGVASTARTVKAARQQAAVAMTAVIASLRHAGVAERDIQTTVLSLQPTYDYRTTSSPPQVTGYVLSNALAVTVRDLDTLGDVIDGALASGATSLDGVTFRVDDQAAAESQARQAAMAEAAAKAKTLADAAHVSIGGVASISESVAPVPYPFYRGAFAGEDVATPIEVGTTEVSVTVTVVYLIA